MKKVVLFLFVWKRCLYLFPVQVQVPMIFRMDILIKVRVISVSLEIPVIDLLNSEKTSINVISARLGLLAIHVDIAILTIAKPIHFGYK